MNALSISICHTPNWNDINAPIQINSIGESFYVSQDDLIKNEQTHYHWDCLWGVYEDTIDYSKFHIIDAEHYVYHGPIDARPEPDYSNIPF